MGLFSSKKEIEADTVTKNFSITVYVYDIIVNRRDNSIETYEDSWVRDTTNGYKIYEPIPTIEETEKPYIDYQHLRELVEERGEVYEYPAESSHIQNNAVYIPSGVIKEMKETNRHGKEHDVDYQTIQWTFKDE